MSTNAISLRTIISFLVAVTFLPSIFSIPAAAQTGAPGFVYVMTNQPTGNAIVQYRRSPDGSLTHLRTVATQGSGYSTGSVDSLGSQDSLVLSSDGTRLLAVNAGSNEISVLDAGSQRLTLLNKLSSGGEFPSSVAVYGSLVYVLNAHGTPNVSGFRLNPNGLTAIANSTYNLPGGITADPHDIRFSQDGTRLLVTEGGTNEIDVLELDSRGLVIGVVTESSVGSNPFGMRFGRNGILVNAEAHTASVSSYALTPEDTLVAISGAVPDTQAAACWISLTNDGRFAFVSNTASGTLSSYQIAGNGTLGLASAVAASLGAGKPIDSALSSGSEFLYVLDSALGRIAAFQIHGGSLKPVGTITGLPTTIQGIAAQ